MIGSGRSLPVESRSRTAAFSKLDDSALNQALSALVAAEFLFEASLYPQLEYSFKHPLTQEVAQGSQLRERRVSVHAAVAQALEPTVAEHGPVPRQVLEHGGRRRSPDAKNT